MKGSVNRSPPPLCKGLVAEAAIQCLLAVILCLKHQGEDRLAEICGAGGSDAVWSLGS